MKIKICGLRTPDDIRAANEVRPDYAGFIVRFSKSFRSIEPDMLRTLVQELDGQIIPVGVFVNAPLELPEQLLREGVIRIAQLHGQESDDYIRQLQSRTGREVIKACIIRDKADVVNALKSPADYILLDQGAGTGQTFDWSLVPKIERKYFLAGGLSERNLKEAGTRLMPWAVDLSSGVETDRKKDVVKMREVVRIIREFPDEI